MLSWFLFLSQDLTKKLERNVDDHEHYKDAIQSCISWLVSAKKKMLSFQQVDGDKECMQQQLRELQVRTADDPTIWLMKMIIWLIYPDQIIHSVSQTGRY